MQGAVTLVWLLKQVFKYPAELESSSWAYLLQIFRVAAWRVQHLFSGAYSPGNWVLIWVFLFCGWCGLVLPVLLEALFWVKSVAVR